MKLFCFSPLSLIFFILIYQISSTKFIGGYKSWGWFWEAMNVFRVRWMILYDPLELRIWRAQNMALCGHKLAMENLLCEAFLSWPMVSVKWSFWVLSSFFLCNHEEETSSHLFWYCPIDKRMWFFNIEKIYARSVDVI